ncbi:MAG: inositol monophosphatase [Fibrobacter sp.]|nr:inositol monophosphatase [Fibrobacter sp.]
MKNQIMDLAIKAATEAGKLIQSMGGKSRIDQKGETFNLVTDADTEAEKLISSILLKGLPDSVFLAEESNTKQNIFAPRLWIIDPLDGTNNFAHNIPHYSVSIAYAENGTVKSGVVYDPVRNELFSAEAQKGAYLNEERISVSKHEFLNESMISTGFYYDRGILMEKTLQGIHTLFKENIRGIRRMGSAALDLCWLACGRYDGYFEYMLSPWDFAAGKIIIEEAGGICADRDGLDRGLLSKGLICSNRLIQKKLMEKVKWNNQEY